MKPSIPPGRGTSLGSPMTRFVLLLALLAPGCHTTVYRSESEPVRIVVTRRAAPARAPAAPEEGGDGGADGRVAPPAPAPARGARR